MRALKRGAHVLGRVQCSLAASAKGGWEDGVLRPMMASDMVAEAALHLLQQVLHLRHNIRQ